MENVNAKARLNSELQSIKKSCFYSLARDSINRFVGESVRLSVHRSVRRSVRWSLFTKHVTYSDRPCFMSLQE